MQETLSLAEQVATKNTAVLITGETGTGKELLAHTIHKLSSRKDRPMIMVNCAALPATLIESELFGAEKGAYTGSMGKRVGRFEVADKSTLFLDEISEFPYNLQAKLLRVLQDNRFERIGSSKTLHVNVRLIAATNQDLRDAVKASTFRKDLYYRLNVFPINMPPLRDRREDIPQLIWFFVKEFSRKMGRSIDHIPKNTMNLLQSYHWPGNIRELKNIIERAMILGSGNVLHIDRLETEEVESQEELSLETVEKNHILKVLEMTGWKIKGSMGAAEILGLKPPTLYSRMKKLRIKRNG
jgi:transcriptional regulator with GAF, ATPase, and Fis domain